MAAERFRLYLSGGAANADPDLSLGGIESSVQINAESPAFDGGGIAGVSLLDGAGNVGGSGTLEYNAAAKTLRWTKPGGVAAAALDGVVVASDGTYTLPAPEGDAFLRVSVTAASLPGSDASDTVAITPLLSQLLDAVPRAEAVAGQTVYRCVYLRNVSGGNLTAHVFIGTAASPDAVAVGTSTTTSGATETAIADELTPPAGVAFSAHYDKATALTLTVNAAQSIGIWVRRTIPPLALDPASPDRCVLAVFT